MGIFRRIKNLFAPVAPTPPPAAADSSDRRAKSRRGIPPDTNILVIDDSATIVALLRRMLRQNGYQTLEAGDAEQGIELAREHQPQLIFLDIVLPGMNGFAALRQLRRDPLTRDIPIIMISGNEQATEEFYVHRIGAEVFARIERLVDGSGRLARIVAGAREAEAEEIVPV